MAALREIRVVFMGTPAVAVTVLEALTQYRPPTSAKATVGLRVVGTVTQPDRPSGRHQRVQESPVAKRATELSIPVFKPKGLKKEENRKFLWDVKPDLLVVAAYGKILPKEVLDLPKFGAVNVHFSLLPRWRGPAPVPAAILAGDAETGVTIMKLDEGMDTGPLLAQERFPIGPTDTTATLLPTLAGIGARLLVPTLEQYLAGQLTPAPQDNTEATVCPMLKKDDGLIDWTKPAEYIVRMVRAYDPWPGTYTTWRGERLLLRNVRILKTSDDGPPSNSGSFPNGTVLRIGETLAVQTGDGLLGLDAVQIEGGKTLPAAQFVNGFPQFVGSRLGRTVSPRL